MIRQIAVASCIVVFLAFCYHESDSKVIIRRHHMKTRAPNGTPAPQVKVMTKTVTRIVYVTEKPHHHTTHKHHHTTEEEETTTHKKKHTTHKKKHTTTEETTTEETTTTTEVPTTTKDPLYKKDEKDFEDCAKKPFEDGAKNFQNSASAGFDPSKQAASYKQNYDEDSADAKKCWDKGQSDASNHMTQERA